jgi:hypothetical protein
MSQSIEVDFAAIEREAESYGAAAAELEARRDYARRQREQVKETMCRWHYEAAGAAMERGWEESANRHEALVDARRGMQEDTHAAKLTYQRTEDENASSLYWRGGDASGSISTASTTEAPPSPPGSPQGMCTDPGAVTRNSRTNRPEGQPFEPGVRPIRPGEVVHPPYLTQGDLAVPPERRPQRLPECSSPDDDNHKGVI